MGGHSGLPNRRGRPHQSDRFICGPPPAQDGQPPLHPLPGAPGSLLQQHCDCKRQVAPDWRLTHRR